MFRPRGDRHRRQQGLILAQNLGFERKDAPVRGISAFDDDEALKHMQPADKTAGSACRFQQQNNELRQWPFGSPRVIWLKKAGPMPPSPIFDDIKSARSKTREKRVETRQRGRKKMRGIINHQVQRTVELSLQDPVQPPGVTLVNRPKWLQPALHMRLRQIFLKIGAVLFVLNVHADVPGRLKKLRPKHHAAAVPQSK